MKAARVMSTKSIPPVIVIGMHRSGTSMITRMLERLTFWKLRKYGRSVSIIFVKYCGYGGVLNS